MSVTFFSPFCSFADGANMDPEMDVLWKLAIDFAQPETISHRSDWG